MWTEGWEAIEREREGESGREREGKGGRQGGRNGEDPACHNSIEEWMLHKRLHFGHPYHAGDRQTEGKFDKDSREKIRWTRPKTGTSERELIRCSYNGEDGTTREKKRVRIEFSMDITWNIKQCLKWENLVWIQSTAFGMCVFVCFILLSKDLSPIWVLWL